MLYSGVALIPEASNLIAIGAPKGFQSTKLCVIDGSLGNSKCNTKLRNFRSFFRFFILKESYTRFTENSIGRLLKRLEPRQCPLRQEVEHGAAAGGHKSEFFFDAERSDGRQCVSAADDSLRAAFSRRRN